MRFGFRRGEYQEGAYVQRHLIFDVFELRHLAKLDRQGVNYEALRVALDDGSGGKRRSTKWQYCDDHPQSRLQLYCATCDRFMCTKCLLREREEHDDHEVHETQDVYDRALADLGQCKLENNRVRDKYIA